MLRCIARYFTNVSEVLAASIIRETASETSAKFYQTTRRRNPEDSHKHDQICRSPLDRRMGGSQGLTDVAKEKMTVSVGNRNPASKSKWTFQFREVK
jgi:hypothetical protein